MTRTEDATMAYAHMITRCKRLAKCDVLRDRYTVLAWRLERRWKRELRRRRAN